jgi:hypothetical protein
MTVDPVLAQLHADDAGLLAARPELLHPDNGVPNSRVAAARQRAAEEIRRVLGDDLHTDGLRVSPLGPAWSTDIDCHVRHVPDAQRLRRAGWIDLSALMARVGYRDLDRWAVIVDNEVIGSADLHRGPPPDPVERILARCRRRGDVRLREVLELRTLVRSGVALPSGDLVVVTAAGIEAALPGPAVLRAWYDGQPRPSPAAIASRYPTARTVRRWLGQLRAAGRRRAVVALGGVDGAGKSTIARILLENLQRAGVPCGAVWSRPGMNLGWLERAAIAVKRASRAPIEPGVRAVARGSVEPPRSRRGLLGWFWSTSVTVVYVVDTARQHLASRGVVVYDRHRTDALVTLDFVYGGVNLGAQSRLVRSAVPRADWTFFLEVPAEVATRRKPDDVFGAHAVRRQIELYGERLPQVPNVVMLDGQIDPHATALMILARIAGEEHHRAQG